jgi:hypothetical protein
LGLKTLAIISGVYDLLLGLPLLVAAPQIAALFGAPPPVPLINAQLNGLFTTTLALGYFWAAGAPEERRGYFWAASVYAKGFGAILFILDHFRGGSPSSYLLFAVTDGTLALLTLAVLSRRR